jgi:DNA-directed RNA polymerase specialized sigma24 family protein
MKDGEARHGIYLAHRSALIDYATPILGSREAAEDIVQDAYRGRLREGAESYAKPRTRFP